MKNVAENENKNSIIINMAAKGLKYLLEFYSI